MKSNYLKLIFAILVVYSCSVFSQVRISNSTGPVDPSAMLEVVSPNRGLLPPVMTESQRDAIAAPANGLMIYCSDCCGGEPQFYINNAWRNALSGAACSNTSVAPTASGVSQTGTANLGNVLTAAYTYTDLDSDLEGTSTFQWYRADNAAGTTNRVAISGATASTYTLAAADVGKFVGVGVTPVAQTGASPGTESRTNPFAGAVTNTPPGSFIWAKSMGGASNDFGHSTALDASGHVYTTGRFVGTVDFDPGAGTANLSSAGGYDIFIQKLDANGDFVWAKSMGGTSIDAVYSTALDASGNVYTTGAFQNTVDFDPGAGTANRSAGGYDIFIQKLDANGNFVWAKSMGGTAGDVGYSTALDASGNVYTTGTFEGTVDFDPGAGTDNHTSAGGIDIFIQKLDANGDFVWAKSMGGTSIDVGYSTALDASGNVYTAGYFRNTVDFDPGAGTANLSSAGSYDIFIQKLDANGNFVWAKSMGGTSDDYCYSIALDASENVYTTGRFRNTVDFDPGAGTANLSSAGGTDIFIQKLDANGDFVWAKSMGGASIDYGRSIALDASGNVYTTGTFQNTVDFDPGAGTANLSSTGLEDIFIQKLDANGNFGWAKSMGGTSADVGYSTALDASGHVYTTGYFYNTVDFDPGAGTDNHTSAGTSDIFVLKLSQ